ncbi:hypothetical protein HDV57DRAFT_59691 [Trichoderma longibrachiatum]
MRSVQRLPLLTPVARQGAPNAIAVPLAFHRTETLPGLSHALGRGRRLIRYVTRGGVKQTATAANRVGGRLWAPLPREEEGRKGYGYIDTKLNASLPTQSWWAAVRVQAQRPGKGPKTSQRALTAKRSPRWPDGKKPSANCVPHTSKTAACSRETQQQLFAVPLPGAEHYRWYPQLPSKVQRSCVASWGRTAGRACSRGPVERRHGLVLLCRPIHWGPFVLLCSLGYCRIL